MRFLPNAQDSKKILRIQNRGKNKAQPNIQSSAMIVFHTERIKCNNNNANAFLRHNGSRCMC